MREVDRIVEQMRLAFEGGAWHGPAVLEVLRDVDALRASNPSIYGAHTIWELVLHLSATQVILLRRIRGEDAGLSDEDFWESVPAPTNDNWQAAVERLTRQERELRAAVTAFPEDKLDQKLMPSGTTTAYANFHGHVQHNTYHAGQIALLKKAYQEIPF
jgi:uncharacterized damage-inducible protein DinB